MTNKLNQNEKSFRDQADGKVNGTENHLRKKAEKDDDLEDEGEDIAFKSDDEDMRGTPAGKEFDDDFDEEVDEDRILH